MIQQPDRPLSVRERQRHTDAIIERLRVEANETLVVLNAFLWKMGIADLAGAEAIVSEYMAYMEKKGKEKNTETVIENFLSVTQNVTPDTTAESK